MWSRCIEQKVGRQNELISGSLTDLGCEQPACDISGSSNNLESLSPTSTEDTQSQSSIGKKKSAHVINILRKPFARKTESPNRYTNAFFKQTKYGCPAPFCILKFFRKNLLNTQFFTLICGITNTSWGVYQDLINLPY